MTGFGLGSAPLGEGKITAEVRAVNGRYLDVRVRMPHDLLDLAFVVEAEARLSLSRGRCDVTIRTEGNVWGAPELDNARIRAAYRSLLELRDEIAPEAEVPFSMLTSVPDLFSVPSRSSAEPSEKAVRAALAFALEDLQQMRRREGSAIGDDLTKRVTIVGGLVDDIEARAPLLASLQAQRLRERLSRIGQDVAEREAMVDPARFEAELLLLLEKADIAEELVRLRSHLAQMTSYMKSEEPVGRRLDFLLQEMSREINTVGAKAQDAEIAHAVVELKSEIERMREQVQNVE